MIFLDTTIWVSAIDTSDQRHLDGRSVLEALLSGELPSRLTIDHVLDETLTVLKRRGLNPGKTMQTVDKILRSPRVEVIFTDAVSLLITKKYGMKTIYSHDMVFDTIPGIERKERP
ncbi:MAG: PIN domain-containing protein [Candidatus Bathyarchaeia archaeon]